MGAMRRCVWGGGVFRGEGAFHGCTRTRTHHPRTPAPTHKFTHAAPLLARARARARVRVRAPTLQRGAAGQVEMGEVRRGPKDAQLPCGRTLRGGVSVRPRLGVGWGGGVACERVSV